MDSFIDWVEDDEIVIRITRREDLWHAYVDECAISGVAFSPAAALAQFLETIESRRVQHEAGVFSKDDYLYTDEQREEEFDFILTMTEETSEGE